MNYEMLDRNKLNELDAYIESFEDKPSHLIMILHRAQGLFGYLPKELQIYVAEKQAYLLRKSMASSHSIPSSR